MTRPHDMGGRFGDGEVTPEPQGIPQLGDWQARALALTLASGSLGRWGIDTSRHAREKLAPADYARFSYFEKWISAMADLLVEKGVVSREELASGASGPADAEMVAKRLKAENVVPVMSRGSPYTRGEIAPAFQPGQSVRTRRPAANMLVDGGHTRLPAYAAGARGRILRHHGAHVLPDSAAHGLGESPEPLYAVVFPAGELWAAPEHPGDEVVLDLWQSYLSADE